MMIRDEGNQHLYIGARLTVMFMADPNRVSRRELGVLGIACLIGALVYNLVITQGLKRFCSCGESYPPSDQDV
jgi:hypothetical protein